MSIMVTLRYFASIRESVGKGDEQLETSAHTVGQLRDELIARGDVYAEALSRQRVLRCAVNQVMVNDDAPISERAEIAFFPPVTGG